MVELVDWCISTYCNDNFISVSPSAYFLTPSPPPLPVLRSCGPTPATVRWPFALPLRATKARRRACWCTCGGVDVTYSYRIINSLLLNIVCTGTHFFGVGVGGSKGQTTCYLSNLFQNQPYLIFSFSFMSAYDVAGLTIYLDMTLCMRFLVVL